MTASDGASVLLGNDEQDILATLGGYLRRSGLEVHTAGNGAAALQLLERPTGVAHRLGSDDALPGWQGAAAHPA